MSAPVAPVRYNALAIVGFVLSFFLTMVGGILGIVALVQIRRTRERGHELGIAAVVVGTVLTGVWIVVVLSAIAIPVLAAPQPAAEDAATRVGLVKAKIAMINYAAENNGTYPADIIGLDGEGFTQTRATADARIIGGGAGGAFCIQATSQAGHEFHITESQGVESGPCAP
jgi:hypothetical protein